MEGAIWGGCPEKGWDFRMGRGDLGRLSIEQEKPTRRADFSIYMTANVCRLLTAHVAVAYKKIELAFCHIRAVAAAVPCAAGIVVIPCAYSLRE